MSLGSKRKAVLTKNQQLIIIILTDPQSVCRQLAQHRPRFAYGLTIFVGSGLIGIASEIEAAEIEGNI